MKFPCLGLSLSLFLLVASPVAAQPEQPAVATDDPVADPTATPAYPEVEDALIVFRRGNLDGALKLLQGAKQKHQELPPAEVMLARFCFAHQQGEQGKQLLERAVAASPDDPEAYLLLGTFAQRAGDLAGADGMFERSLEKAEALPKDNPRRKRLSAAALAGLAIV
ncbi:MAG: tetratricopeptide repeat protein, partial [Pirellulales bacterium]